MVTMLLKNIAQFDFDVLFPSVNGCDLLVKLSFTGDLHLFQSLPWVSCKCY